MAGIKSYLTRKQKQELIVFHATVGASYEKYLEWCFKRDIKPFTKYYFYTWRNRYLDKIRAVAKDYDDNVRRMSTFDRDRRLEEYENDVVRINMMLHQEGDGHDCSFCGNPHIAMQPRDFNALMQTKDKLMQSIAKERGEYGKVVKSISKESDAVEAFRAQALERLSAAEPETTQKRPFTMDASYRVLSE